MAYGHSNQYADPRWQKLRLEILSRDEWACTSCIATNDELHVHHIRYVTGKKLWEYEASDLTTLCRTCHEYRTSLTREARQCLYEMIECDPEIASYFMREGALLFCLGLPSTLVLIQSMSKIARAVMDGADQSAIHEAVIGFLESVTAIAGERKASPEGKESSGT